MKKTLFLILTLYGFNSAIYAQTVLLDEGFESYTSFSINSFGSWTTLDLDGLTTRTLGGDPAPPTNWVANWPNAYQPQAYQIFEPSAANVTNDATGVTGEIRNFDPHSGSKYAGSWAGEMVTSFEGNEDWLISPAITLGSSGNELSLWVKTLSNSYGDERFRIGVYTGTGNPTSSTDFTIISADYSATEPYQYAYSYWTERTLNLDAYSGQTIKIGVYCMTQQGSMLMIDDFKVTTTGTLATSEIESSNSEIEIFPNPVSDFINVKSQEKVISIEVIDFTGKVIKKGNSKSMNISDLKTGNYLIRITTENQNNTTIKFIKL